MSKVRAALVDHVGGEPTPMQGLLIEQAVVLALRIHLLDVGFVRGRATPEAEGYLGMLNALDRLRMRLTELPTAAAKPSAGRYDAALALAARAAVGTPDDAHGGEIQAEARRMAYGSKA